MAEQSGGYSAAQLAAMQRDAVKRVNEMQRIARERVGAPSSVPFSAQAQSARPQFVPPRSAPPIRPPTEQPPTEQPPTEQPPTEQPPTERPQTEQPPTERPQTEQPQTEPPQTERSGLSGFLDRLNLGEDSIIIILMLVLLVNEGADNMLILALVYILL